MKDSVFPEGVTAMDSLGIQCLAMHSMLRALLHTHPDRAAVRQAYDQLLGQHLANPGVLLQQGYSQHLREVTELLFREPAALDQSGPPA